MKLLKNFKYTNYEGVFIFTNLVLTTVIILLFSIRNLTDMNVNVLVFISIVVPLIIINFIQFIYGKRSLLVLLLMVTGFFLIIIKW